MGQPLAIAVLGPRPEVAAGDLGEPEGEAAVPGPLGDRLDAVEVRDLGDAGAEAGRADERAVGAGEAALGDLGPARALRGGDEPVRQPGGRDRVADLRPGGRNGGAGRGLLRLGRRAQRQRLEQVLPAGEPERTTNPSSSSVRARSNPPVTSGPVPIDVQKQVLAALTHSTAMTSAAARRAT